MNFFLSFNILVEFLAPELNSCFWLVCISASLMSVPEATVDKYYGIIFRQNNVWFSRQVFDMQPESISGSVESGPDSNFRLGVLRPDSGHVPASFFFCESIQNYFNFDFLKISNTTPAI